MHPIPLAIYRTMGRIFPSKRVGKLANIPRRVWSRIKYGDYWFFTGVSIETSTACNRSCHYCPQSKEKFPQQIMGDFTFDLVCRRLADLKWDGIVTLSLFNEPGMMGQRLVDLTRRLARKVPGCIPVIQTNGDFMTRDFLRNLVYAGAVTIVITEHPPFSVNWRAKLLPLAAEFPRHVRLNKLEPWEMVNRAGTVDCVPARPDSPCHIASWVLSVDVYGRVQHCTQDYWRRRIVGDLRSQTIRDIWFAEPWRSTRRDLRRGIKRHEICQSCSGLAG